MLALMVVDIGAVIARVPSLLRGETGGVGEVAWSPIGGVIALTNNNVTVCPLSSVNQSFIDYKQLSNFVFRFSARLETRQQQRVEQMRKN